MFFGAKPVGKPGANNKVVCQRRNPNGFGDCNKPGGSSDAKTTNLHISNYSSLSFMFVLWLIRQVQKQELLQGLR